MRNLDKKRVVVSSVFLLGILAMAVVLGLRREDEPAFHGRKLSSWLEKLRDSRRANPEAVNAIQTIGTNGLPTLLRKLRRKDFILKNAVCDWLRLRHALPRPFTTEREEKADAVTGFKILGPRARPALPALEELLSDEWRSASFAANAIGAIGPDGIPVLVNALKARKDIVRGYAAATLSQVGPLGGAEAEAAAVLLTQQLKHPNPFLRCSAAIALGKVGAPPSVLPVLIAGALGDPQFPVRAECVTAMATFTNQARSILQYVERLTNDRSLLVQNNAFLALRKLNSSMGATNEDPKINARLVK